MLPINSTIGIIGGGQLGRMLALSAAQLGMKTVIFCPDEDSPAFDVTPNKIIAPYDDEDALRKFANLVDVITYEFENLPLSSIIFLEKLKPVAPNSRALSISQNRLTEKGFLQRNEIAIAAFEPVKSLDNLKSAIKKISLPAVLKTCTMGYDGKGQVIIRKANEAEAAFDKLKGLELVLEEFVPFEREISVIVARNSSGQVRDYEASENIHKNHILDTSTVPANIDRLTAQRASRIAQQIIGALDYIGVMGIEFFISAPDPDAVDKRAKILVNEIAPRVHNSGHWTQAACLTNQFEQHIRAICNWQLGDPSRYCNVVMQNLIGDEVNEAAGKLESGMQPHFYGKTLARKGRKMGHINIKTS
jgi:5-(carboxyamino)imidazole ribonucleotide synthase